MVGGYSESPFLYRRVKSEFPELNVICPSDAVAAILKGAVMQCLPV
jgi:molecular chaperone DnaK (HSP70)